MDCIVHFSDQLKPHLRSLRKARGLTQVQLAQRLGVVQSRVAAIESKPETMSVESLFKVLAALDVQLILRDAKSLAQTTPDIDSEPNPPKGSW
jgi:HTH-type transcriptional regulator / antitoxin HipB